MRPGKLLAILSLALPFLLTGCAVRTINAWPLLFYETRQVETADGPQTLTTTEVLYPLFSRESDGETTWHAVRPIYNYERRPGGWSRVQYLWPLGLHFKDGDKVWQHRFFPLFQYHKSWSPLTKKYATHAHLAQLLRWGRDDVHGPYLALFPLAGVTHGVLADTWSFVAFPLYSHWRHGDYVRNDFPWPFFGYGSTADGTRKLWRFWPFYVRQRKDKPDDFRERHDLMWPFLRWGRWDAGGRYYHKVFAVLGFYSHVKTYDRQDELVSCLASVLGVFFCVGTPPEGGRTGWSFLWSLVRSQETTNTEEFRVFPFFVRKTQYAPGGRESGRRRLRYIAPWPLVWVDSDTWDPNHRKNGLVIAPLYWHYKDTLIDDDGSERTGRRITLFPLMTFEQTPDGGKHFWVASHGWKDESKGSKRNYGDLLNLFQFHREPDGRKEIRVFSRLYEHRRSSRGRLLRIAGLFTYDGTAEVVGEDGKYVSALFGLVKCSWTEGRRRWRVFYIPLGGSDRSDMGGSDGGG